MDLAYRPDLPASSAVIRDELVAALAALSRVLVGLTARSLGSLDIDLTLPQYRTVVVLATHGPQRTIDLARALGVHPSTVTRLCDRLIHRGLIHREHRPPDRRVAWLILTAEGREVVERIIQRRTAALAKLVESAPLDGAEQVVRLLSALVTASGEQPERQWRSVGHT
ncbi:MarR family transcriptional regulator [Plantactinospora sp. B6F1]|uniref:MarR family winged helix-turn-helix transcriptional regulator n=1 Tax=Plantactinospora sp. B6F1 TaxID=3158971 RepID=UPI0032D95719